jgi:nitroreductase
MSHARPATERETTAALSDAAAIAGYAPSILNTQPWLWRVRPDRLDLRAERGRQLAASDPEGRLLTLSCGAALHHARVSLAAAGWAAHVRRMPEPGDMDLLATLEISGRMPVTVDALRLLHAVQTRHTDRRPVSDKPLPDAALQAIAVAARGEAGLHVLTPEQVIELAAAGSRAGAVEAGDPYIRAEFAYWTGRAASEGIGIPAEALPERPAPTTVPGRNFGQPGTLPVGSGHDRAAVYALLFGDTDRPESWLRAGEALSAAWLTATDLGVSVVPLSGVIEIADTRQTLRHMLADLGYPYLVLRLGLANAEPARPVHTPRLPTTQMVDTSAVRPTAR